jgi:hypothetical protein
MVGVWWRGAATIVAAMVSQSRSKIESIQLFLRIITFLNEGLAYFETFRGVEL